MDQSDLELKDALAFPSLVLGLKACSQLHTWLHTQLLKGWYLGGYQQGLHLMQTKQAELYVEKKVSIIPFPK